MKDKSRDSGLAGIVIWEIRQWGYPKLMQKKEIESCTNKCNCSYLIEKRYYRNKIILVFEPSVTTEDIYYLKKSMVYRLHSIKSNYSFSIFTSKWNASFFDNSFLERDMSVSVIKLNCKILIDRDTVPTLSSKELIDFATVTSRMNGDL